MLALLLIGVVASGVASADSQTKTGKTGSTPRGAPGATTSAQATQLETGFSYQGAVNRRAKRLWYRLDGTGAKRMVFHLRGKSRLCAVRASVLDASGRPLAQLITSPDETLPFVVMIPTQAASDTYYLRIDANPFASCVNAAYVFTLVEPEQPGGALEPKQSTATGKAGRAPAVRARLARTENACEAIGTSLWHATVAVAKERSLVFHKRAGIATLRRLERRRRALARRVYHVCSEF